VVLLLASADRYRRLGLAGALGGVGRKFWAGRPRLDDDDVLGEAMWPAVSLANPRLDHTIHIFAVEYLTALVDADFQAAVAGVAVETGGLASAAPAKSLLRMLGKLEGDHAKEEEPKVACNIDCSRNCLTYDTAQALERGFDALARRFKVLRVKNSYREDFDAERESFGYRAILANVLYIPTLTTTAVAAAQSTTSAAATHPLQQHDPADDAADGSPASPPVLTALPAAVSATTVSWGQLAERPEAQAAVAKVRRSYHALGYADTFDAAARAAMEVLRDQPARFVVETQFITREYLSLRKKSHLFYKVARGTSMRVLAVDFSKYAAERPIVTGGGGGGGRLVIAGMPLHHHLAETATTATNTADVAAAGEARGALGGKDSAAAADVYAALLAQDRAAEQAATFAALPLSEQVAHAARGMVAALRDRATTVRSFTAYCAGVQDRTNDRVARLLTAALKYGQPVDALARGPEVDQIRAALDAVRDAVDASEVWSPARWRNDGFEFYSKY
jgi:hypothetical protein